MADLPDNFEDQIPTFETTGSQEHSKDAEWLSKLTILAAGAHVFSRAVGRNFFAEAMDLAGRGSRYISELKRKVGPEFLPETSDMLYKTLNIHPDAGGKALTLGVGGARAADLDVIQDIAESLRILQRPETHARSADMEELFRRHFNSLPISSGSAIPSGLHHDLKPLTFGEILDNNNSWVKNVGSNTFETTTSNGRRVPLSLGVIEEAINQKWITRDTIVDANLFTAKGGRVIDMRMTNPKTAVKQLSDVFDIAGIFKAASDFMTSGRKVGQVNPSVKYGQNFVIGGTLYDVQPFGISVLAKNQKLGTVGDARFEVASLRRARDEGRLGDVYSKDTGSGLYNAIQEKLGVGTKFHDKQGFGLPFFKNFIKNVRAIGNGEAVFYAKPYRPANSNSFGRFFSTLGPDVNFTGAEGRAYSKAKYHGEGFLEKDKLSFRERVLAYAGANKDVLVVNAEAKEAIRVTKSDLTSDFDKSGIKSLQQAVGETRGVPTGVNQMGQLETTERASSYAISGGTSGTFKDFTSYLAVRLNSLVSSTGIGIGFRPSGSSIGNVTRLAAIPAAYMALTEGIKYADYAVEEVTGVSPIEAAATLYTKARVAQQQIRENTGIAQGANYIENAIAPGLDVGLLGTIGSAFLGGKILGKGGTIGKALTAAGALYAAVGGPNVGQDSEQLKRQYSGEEKVAVKRARWWGLGYQPFSGSQIDHYAPSWYRQLVDKPGTVNTYGSEDNYWKNVSLLPTPSNLFGLKPLLDPYWLEKRNYYNRPYPVTGGIFEEVPVFGPILSDTVGALIKPRKKMHTESAMVANANITERQVPANIESQLGIPMMPTAIADLNRPDVLKDRLNKWANVALEPTGIWKFAMEFFGVSFDDGYKLADAGNMNSISRSFYNLNLGGLGGQTEFIRRFLMSDYGNPSSINEQVNPIPNTLPRWLPGSLSENETDRSYFIDFTRGDAYTKILGGEYRLPGAGYEAVNKLHSEESGVYDNVDKLLILADVAPNSSNFFKARSQVQGMSLSPEWQARVERSLAQRDKKLDKYGFGTQDIVAKSNLNPISRSLRSGWDSAYSILEEVPYVGSKFFPKRDPLEHYVKYQVEGDEFANWNSPYETVVRPAIYDTMGSNPLMAAIKGGILGGVIAGPVGKYMNPIAATRISPAINTAVGAGLGATLSTARMAYTGNISGGFTPGHVTKEREVSEYFDYLQYSKYTNLAYSTNNAQLRQTLLKKAESTTAYGLATLQTTGNEIAYERSLSAEDKEYFKAFKNTGVNKRESVLNYVPGHMASALQTVWGGESQSSSKGAHAVARENTAEYFKNHTTPSSDWAGWSPSVPLSAIKIKSIDAGVNSVSNSVHRFGYFPAQEREVALRFPFLEGITDIKKKPKRNDNSIVYDMFGDYVPFGNVQSLDFGAGPNIDINYSTIEDTRENDVFSFYQLYR